MQEIIDKINEIANDSSTLIALFVHDEKMIIVIFSNYLFFIKSMISLSNIKNNIFFLPVPSILESGNLQNDLITLKRVFYKI